MGGQRWQGLLVATNGSFSWFLTPNYISSDYQLAGALGTLGGGRLEERPLYPEVSLVPSDQDSYGRALCRRGVCCQARQGGAGAEEMPSSRLVCSFGRALQSFGVLRRLPCA